jgi:hypothetical protein
MVDRRIDGLDKGIDGLDKKMDAIERKIGLCSPAQLNFRPVWNHTCTYIFRYWIQPRMRRQHVADGVSHRLGK